MGSAVFERLCRIGSDRDGTVAIAFSLTAIMMASVAGLAVDVGRVTSASSKLSAAIDSAALAGAKGLRQENLSDAEVTAVAETYFQRNMGEGGSSNYAAITAFKVTIDRPKSAVQIEVAADVKTVLGQLAGVEKFSISKSAAAIFDQNDIEVALQLDVTASMCMPCTKITDLKLATKDLVDTLIPDNPTGSKVRIGYAPFSAGVNAGSYARAVNGNRSSTCTYERRTSTNQYTDAAPIGTNALKIRSDLSSSAQSCPNAKVLPMTDDKALLKSTVDSYQVGGTTAGHLGTAWAWYLLSPDWASIWPSASTPAPYNDSNTMKIAVLMTDGEYNTVGGIMSGANETLSGEMAVATCAGMKSENIIVYTVGFMIDNTAANNVLSKCASDSSKFFRAENGEDLRRAFRAIAEDIANVWLMK